MNAFALIIPLFVIRFGLLKMINPKALHRASLFAPLKENEKFAFVFYQVSNFFIILYPLFLKIKLELPLIIIALLTYTLGISIFAVSTIHFAHPKENDINTNGIYRFSRNPMYLGYFLYYLGCALLTRSIILFIAVIIFQISAHWIVLSEERWCIEKFGNEYLSYMLTVRRYI